MSILSDPQASQHWGVLTWTRINSAHGHNLMTYFDCLCCTFRRTKIVGIADTREIEESTRSLGIEEQENLLGNFTSYAHKDIHSLLLLHYHSLLLQHYHGRRSNQVDVASLFPLMIYCRPHGRTVCRIFLQCIREIGQPLDRCLQTSIVWLRSALMWDPPKHLHHYFLKLDLWPPAPFTIHYCCKTSCCFFQICWNERLSTTRNFLTCWSVLGHAKIFSSWSFSIFP